MVRFYLDYVNCKCCQVNVVLAVRLSFDWTNNGGILTVYLHALTVYLLVQVCLKLQCTTWTYLSVVYLLVL